jgi:hypothetical protein
VVEKTAVEEFMEREERMKKSREVGDGHSRVDVPLTLRATRKRKSRSGTNGCCSRQRAASRR